ncbi:MAG: hypothetical protein RLZZ511_3120 [Cyanobacteriota bacterium]|jgi:hypothetical protein
MKRPTWLQVEPLPDLEIAGECWAEPQILELLAALKASSLTAPDPYIAALKDRVAPSAIADFVWALFWSWHHGDGDSKDSWVMRGLGLLGDDTTVFKLVPLLREMPGLGLSKRAAIGLECLRTIGSDLALMQINQIAQKIKYKSLKTKAEECMNAIGESRNLTREQLNDRIIPDCGFDAQGVREFDYGDRQFQVRLGAELQLTVQDPAGKKSTRLPPAKATDDATKATQAIADWKLLKQQVAAVLKEQTQRLEQAMVNQRAWSIADFETIVLAHPLLGQIARRLIWIDAAGSQTFRVTEDGTYADAQDNTVTLIGVNTVGVAHPAQLTLADRAQWGELLSDYGMIPPFRQLTRTLFELEPLEVARVKLDRFKGIGAPSMVASSIFKNTGWQMGRDRYFYCHYKTFGYAGVTAIVEHEGDFRMDYDLRAILGKVWFVAGEEWKSPLMPLEEVRLVPLAAVHPVALSEVIRLVGAIAAKAED